MNLFRLAVSAVLGGAMVGSVVAQENTASITVEVTVNAEPCEINNNQLIDVDFGDSVVTTDVANGTVKKNISYTLDCTNASQSKTLIMSIIGNGADFDEDLLQTSITSLGIKLKADGANFPLNTNLELASSASKPKLTAILVQQPGSRLPTGGFTAGATMTVAYQ